MVTAPMIATRGPTSHASATGRPGACSWLLRLPTVPPTGPPVVRVEVDRPQQAFAEPAADGGPALPGPIVGDEPVAFGGTVQRAVEGVPVERPKTHSRTPYPAHLPAS